MLERAEGHRSILDNISGRKANWPSHISGKGCLQKLIYRIKSVGNEDLERRQ